MRLSQTRRRSSKSLTSPGFTVAYGGISGLKDMKNINPVGFDREGRLTATGYEAPKKDLPGVLTQFHHRKNCRLRYLLFLGRTALIASYKNRERIVSFCHSHEGIHLRGNKSVKFILDYIVLSLISPEQGWGAGWNLLLWP